MGRQPTSPFLKIYPQHIPRGLERKEDQKDHKKTKKKAPQALSLLVTPAIHTPRCQHSYGTHPLLACSLLGGIVLGPYIYYFTTTPYLYTTLHIT